jgi:transcriptional regulator with XRE-family HTH domain
MATDPARYFGKQVRKARLTASLTLKEFGDQICYSAGQISRIESGTRPPNKVFAKACDGAFPDMGGWFSDLFDESREWMATPPWFRPWIEHEQSARVLKIWTCGLFPGIAQGWGPPRSPVCHGSGRSLRHARGHVRELRSS